jgi:hypothetical protein
VPHIKVCCDAPLELSVFAAGRGAGRSGRPIAELEGEGQVSAIGKSLAVIELDLDRTIRHANDNFLMTVGSLNPQRGAVSAATFGCMK